MTQQTEHLHGVNGRRLTTYVKFGVAVAHLEEEQLLDAEDVIDAGFYLEIYGNPDGKTSDSGNGASLFTYVDRDVTYDELLKAVAHLGSLRDDELSIRTVGHDETEELGFCRENPISKLVNSTRQVPA